MYEYGWREKVTTPDYQQKEAAHMVSHVKIRHVPRQEVETCLKGVFNMPPPLPPIKYTIVINS